MEKSKFPSAIKKNKNDLDEINTINWVKPLLDVDVALALWHRPQIKQIGKLKESKNLTCVVTLQTESEKCFEIRKKCVDSNVSWIHAPLKGANMAFLNTKEAQDSIINGIKQVTEIFEKKQKENILIHCAAGIHRTGVFCYSLLRILGFSSESSRETLRNLREATIKGVGEDRLKYAEIFIVEKWMLANKKEKEKRLKESENATG